jgi:hypothetical protein
MQITFWKQGFVLMVIMLFLGVGIQPVVATEQKVVSNEKYYDVPIELCGLGKTYTVQLSNQQLIEIDELFETIKDDLDNAKTNEETIRIYSDAIAKLDRYGLLGDYNAKQVQNLIIGTYLKSSNNHVLHKLYENKQSSDQNILCLMCGHTDNTYFFPGTSMLLYRLIEIFSSEDLRSTFFLLVILRLVFWSILLDPFRINIPVALGSGIRDGPNSNYISGWIHTLGLFGVKNWTGELYGKIFVCRSAMGNNKIYFGVTGFTGIKIIRRPLDYYYLDYYYLGFAFNVHLGTREP